MHLTENTRAQLSVGQAEVTVLFNANEATCILNKVSLNINVPRVPG